MPEEKQSDAVEKFLADRKAFEDRKQALIDVTFRANPEDRRSTSVRFRRAAAAPANGWFLPAPEFSRVGGATAGNCITWTRATR